MARPRIARCAPLAALLLAACSTETPVEHEARPAAPAAPEIRLHTEPISRIRFPLPATGVSVEERHHDATLPPHKFRHSIRVSTTAGNAVQIDVWDNPQHLALRPWFDAHLAFLVDADTRVTELPVARGRTPGILVQKPRSPQSFAQAIAVFATGDQVFRVTGNDYEGDPAARALFDGIVDQIELGVTP